MEKRNINPKNTKKNKISKKRKNIVKISFKRMMGLLCIFLLFFAILIGRIGYLQFVQGAWLKQKEYSQSTSNTVISAKRGTIYDANGKALAISAAVDTISVNPVYINVKNDGITDKEKTQELKEKMAQEFADVFELNYDDVLKKLTSDRSVETIVSKVESDKVEILKKYVLH